MNQPQSNFLPGTKVQFAWDSTTLGAFKQCPRLYKYLYLDGWDHAEESVHLRFGQEFHTALQDYALSRAAKISHEDSVFDVVKALLERTGDYKPDADTKAGKYKSRNMLLRAVIWYLDEHAEDPAETYIKADGKPAVELSFRFELDWGPSTVAWKDTRREQVVGGDKIVTLGQDLVSQPYLLCGHLDRVVSFAGSLFVMDHKTTTTTPSQYYFDQFSPNNQMTLYTIASKIEIYSPVKGVLINAVQLMLDYDKTNDYGAQFVRGFTYRTPDQLEEWLTDLRFWLEQAERYAEADYWPMNDTSCDKFGGCRFRDICSKSPQVREQFLKSDFEKLEEDDRWNPLKSR